MVHYPSHHRVRKSNKPLYPVGGYTKRIDQYGAVPPSVLAEERRLQQLESHIEKGRRWQLAQCERKKREAAEHLRVLNEAKGKAWLPTLVGHTEYLYGGCLAVRVEAGDYGYSTDEPRLQNVTEALTCDNRCIYGKSRPFNRATLTEDIPRTKHLRPKVHRKPRSWAALKKQFQEEEEFGGDKLPHIHSTCPMTAAGQTVCGSKGDVSPNNRRRSTADDFVDDMARCRYLRVPARYGDRPGEDDD